MVRKRLKSLHRVALKLSAFAALCSGLTGCLIPGLDKQSAKLAIYPRGLASVGSKVSGSPLEVFSKTVYTITQAKCATCHATQQSPTFSSSDLSTSYSVTKGLVSFTNPGSSRLVDYGGNGHCGGSCDVSNRTSLVSAIQQWAAAEASGGGGLPTPDSDPAPDGLDQNPGTVRSTALTIPDLSGVTGNNWARVRFNLSGFTPAVGITDGVFEVEMQEFTPASADLMGSIQIRFPRIGSPTTGIWAKGIKIILNGRYDPILNTYHRVDSLVPPGGAISTTGTPPPAIPYADLGNRATLIIPNIKPYAQGNTLVFSFDVLQASAAVVCRNLAGFIATVRPRMAASCYNCHQNVNSGGARFRLNAQDDAGTCAQVLARADRANPANSSFILVPRLGLPLTNGNNHNTINISADIDAWIAWVQSEVQP